MCSSFDIHIIDFQDPIAPEDSCNLGSTTWQDCRYVLQRSVQFSIDRLQVASLADLSSNIEPEPSLSFVDGDDMRLQNPVAGVFFPPVVVIVVVIVNHCCHTTTKIS